MRLDLCIDALTVFGLRSCDSRIRRTGEGSRYDRHRSNQFESSAAVIGIRRSEEATSWTLKDEADLA